MGGDEGLRKRLIFLAVPGLLERYADGSWYKTQPTRDQILNDARNILQNNDLIIGRGLLIEDTVSLLWDGDLSKIIAGIQPSYHIALNVRNEDVSFEPEYILTFDITYVGREIIDVQLSGSYATPLNTSSQREIDAIGE